MSKYTRQDILEIVDEEDVEFIRLQFTDLFGTFKNIAITRSNLERALDNNYMFDASGICGFNNQGETDFYLYPDLDTFVIFPWRPQQGKVARFICDVYTAERKPYINDSRYMLKEALSKCEKMGFTFDVGAECEFYLFNTDEIGRPTTISFEEAGYLDIGPTDQGENIRRDIVLTLEDMEFEIDSSYHEKDISQHEVDFKYNEALSAADDIMTFKLAVKTVAKKHGLYATFMPKAINSGSGSGMHLNLSLSEDGQNSFYSKDDLLHLSQTAYQFMAGILNHIKAITYISNPLVNSYKRFTADSYAPKLITWSNKGKSPLIRIPYVTEKNARIELRSPDATCNPYLVFALLLECGLDGIKNEMTPHETTETLPLNLKEAEKAFLEDKFVQDILGHEISQQYVESKSKEWEEFQSYVTDWELKKYLARF